MYAKGKMFVTYFHVDTENTEKVAYGRVSEAFKVTDKTGQPVTQDGKQVYEYETWNARFVGKAKKKFDATPLNDKASIILTEWSARNPYNKEKKTSYPYILIMDYEMNER